MRGHEAVAMLTACVVCTGCFSGFKHPLGSVGQSFIDKPLLGIWVCRSDDDPDPTELTFADFDGRQYLLLSEEKKGERSSHRVIGSRVGDSTFVSLRAVAPKAEDEWTILQYVFDDADHLSLKFVDPEPFEDVLDDAAAVRDRLAERLDDPEVILGLLSCSRHNSTGS